MSYNILTLIMIALFVCHTQQALNNAADIAIKQAIKSAVLDGLNIIDTQMRNTYWYFLNGAQRVTFNVTIKPDKLNYIIIYNNIGNIYRVNCDLIKANWLTSLNSFVKILNDDISMNNSKTNIHLIDQYNNSLDLTNNIAITGFAAAPTNSKTIETSAILSPNQNKQSSGSNMVILSSVSSNNAVNNQQPVAATVSSKTVNNLSTNSHN